MRSVNQRVITALHYLGREGFTVPDTVLQQACDEDFSLLHDAPASVIALNLLGAAIFVPLWLEALRQCR